MAENWTDHPTSVQMQKCYHPQMRMNPYHQSWHGQAGQHGWTNVKDLPAVMHGAHGPQLTASSASGMAVMRVGAVSLPNCRTTNPFKQPMKQEYRSAPTFSY
eukprot:8250821-Pyramimonas_sp.AAC.1